MIGLAGILAFPLAAGLAAWAAGGRRPAASRWISLAGLVAAGACAAGARAGGALDASLPWIPALGIRFHLAMDGLSFLMVLLAVGLGLAAVGCSWTEIRERTGFFHFNLLWTLTGVLGVFLARDLLLFFFFWEMMLVPMYLLIGIWGHERRIRAAIKFFLFTQAGGLLMLVSILGLAFARREETGALSFAYADLLQTNLEGPVAFLLMLGFFLAFAVKLPAVPLHTWLPEAHTEAPTAGSVILAGVLLKTGAYGLLRFAVPLFPEASRVMAPAAMVLGVAGILYGAKLAFAQTDLKRLVAYTSVSHLGFVLLGIYSFREPAHQGVVMQMICHALSTGGLFILVGQIQERTGVRDLERLGGLWSRVPRMGAFGMILAMASLGLPGLGNFVAEVLILAGTFRRSAVLAAVAALGLVAATVYSLRIVQRVFHGPLRDEWSLTDLGAREAAILAILAAALLWLGLAPQPVLDLSGPVPAAPVAAELVEGRG